MAVEIKKIDQGSVTSPPGFRAAATTAGIKPSGNPDVGLLLSEVPCTAAGLFTTNQLKGESMRLTMQRVADGRAQGLLVNSGVANACTGITGRKDALTLTRIAANGLGLLPKDILPNSTGVIGNRLPMDLLKQALPNLLNGLDESGGPAFAQAMMTTDTVPKFSAREVNVDGTRFILGGAAKGAGMIFPRMATMFGFMTTDAPVEVEALRLFLRTACDASFNRLTIDGDTSCCDTVLVLANGMEGGEPIRPDDGPRARAFQEALTCLCRELTFRLAHDGEGVHHVVTIRVDRAQAREHALQVARSIALSPLVKTAIHGCDPNWGRIVNAAGYSGAPFFAKRATLCIGDIEVFRHGCRTDFDEDEVHRLMQQREYDIRLSLNLGEASDFVITTDFSKEYVDINADYAHRT